MSSHLTLFLPDLRMLLGAASSLTSYPALQKIFSLARVVPGPCNTEDALRFFFKGLPERELPYAVLSAVGEGMTYKEDPRSWCTISPIACQLDQNTGYLLGEASLGLSITEKTALFNTIIPFLQEDGITLLPSAQGQGYAHVAAYQQVILPSMEAAWHKNMQSYLPSGPDAAYWKRLMTECQMLLANHPVNQERRRHYQQEVASFWFWGLGSYPQNISSGFDIIITDDPALKGIHQALEKLPLLIEGSLENIVWPQENKGIFCGSFAAHRLKVDLEDTAVLALLREFELQYFAPAWEALIHKKLGNIVLICGDGLSYEVKNRYRAYFWKGNKPLSYFALKGEL